MFVAASSRCFEDVSLAEACQQISDLGYDKIVIWMDEKSEHMKPSYVAASPERFFTQFREWTRLTPVALTVEDDVSATASVYRNDAIQEMFHRHQELTLPDVLPGFSILVEKLLV